MGVPRISVVGSTYQGEETVEAFYEEARAAADDLGESYEIVLVDDDSRDGTFECLRAIQQRDPEHVRVFRLSRNFGHHAAVEAALQRARGELIFLLDTDLQDDPALLGRFMDELREHEVDVVMGYQEKRSGTVFERLGGAIFWRLFARLAGLRIQPNQLTVRLMTRRYVSALLELNEMHRFTAGMMEWIGFPQHASPVVKRKRGAGRSSYNLARKINLLITAVTSFSSYPLVLSVRLGAIVMTAGLGYGAYLVGRKLLYPDTIVQGFASVISIILAVGGLNLFVVGFVGLYLARTYEQVKRRPNYVVMDSIDDVADSD